MPSIAVTTLDTARRDDFGPVVVEHLRDGAALERPVTRAGPRSSASITAAGHARSPRGRGAPERLTSDRPPGGTSKTAATGTLAARLPGAKSRALRGGCGPRDKPLAAARSDLNPTNASRPASAGLELDKTSAWLRRAGPYGLAGIHTLLALLVVQEAEALLGDDLLQLGLDHDIGWDGRRPRASLSGLAATAAQKHRD